MVWKAAAKGGHMSILLMKYFVTNSFHSTFRTLASCDMAFSPSVLVDILTQINAHNKKCAQDIQGYQRSLAHKIKGLDEFTSKAVKDLGNIHQEAKIQSDHLLSGQEQWLCVALQLSNRKRRLRRLTLDFVPRLLLFPVSSPCISQAG